MRCFYRPHSRVQFDNSVVDPNTGEVTYPPSKTKQEHVKECDINNILKQFSRTGMLTHVSAKAAAGAFMDLPDHVDFQESLAQVAHAQASFMALPSKLRDRFHNDPAAFLQFCENPANAEELITLGIRQKPAEPVAESTPAPPSPTPTAG